MTTLQAIQFAAQIQVGSLIESTYMNMRVTKIGAKRVTGYDEKYFKTRGRKVEIDLSYEMFLNPHYNKDFKISK